MYSLQTVTDPKETWHDLKQLGYRKEDFEVISETSSEEEEGHDDRSSVTSSRAILRESKFDIAKVTEEIATNNIGLSRDESRDLGDSLVISGEEVPQLNPPEKKYYKSPLKKSSKLFLPVQKKEEESPKVVAISEPEVPQIQPAEEPRPEPVIPVSQAESSPELSSPPPTEESESSPEDIGVISPDKGGFSLSFKIKNKANISKIRTQVEEQTKNKRLPPLKKYSYYPKKQIGVWIVEKEEHAKQYQQFISKLNF